MKCPKCGAQVSDKETECPYCRTEFIVLKGIDCPSCGKHNPADAVFCSSCGLRLLPEKELINNEMVFCPKCGAEVSVKETECPYCRTDLHISDKEPKEKVCPSCGTKNAYGAKYCYKCGLNLLSTPPVQKTAMNAQPDDSPSIVGSLIVGAIALILLGVALYNFKVYYDTLYTINGISTDEAPKYLATACVFLVVSFGVGIADIANYHKNK